MSTTKGATLFLPVGRALGQKFSSLHNRYIPRERELIKRLAVEILASFFPDLRNAGQPQALPPTQPELGSGWKAGVHSAPFDGSVPADSITVGTIESR